MQRVMDPSGAMEWLAGRPAQEALTGYEMPGWPASAWVLHAMYENPDLRGLGTHDDVHRRRVEFGAVAPLIIGDVNMDEIATVSGTPLGFVVSPGQPWLRLRWEDYLSRFPDVAAARAFPPSDSWFPAGSWPLAVEPPPEGSLDEESLAALADVLGARSPDGARTPVLAFFGSLPAGGDFDAIHLWAGPLGEVMSLLEDHGGPYRFSPTNIWPVDRTWFVWTDYDLPATRVSGDPALIAALVSNPHLECIRCD